jgi:hypothetical protein
MNRRSFLTTLIAWVAAMLGFGLSPPVAFARPTTAASIQRHKRRRRRKKKKKKKKPKKKGK